MKLTKVQLEIYPEKVMEFYFSLLTYKTTGDTKVLKAFADSIHFDNQLISTGFNITEKEEKEIDTKFETIHDYLSSTSEDKKYYGFVLEGFKERKSEFSKEIYELFRYKEILKKWIGKNESGETKTLAAVISYSLNLIAKTFSNVIGESVQEVSEFSSFLNNYEDIKIVNNGSIIITDVAKNSFQCEIFLKKGKVVKRIFITEDNFESLLGKNSSQKHLLIKINNSNIIIELRQRSNNLYLTEYHDALIENERIIFKHNGFKKTKKINLENTKSLADSVEQDFSVQSKSHNISEKYFENNQLSNFENGKKGFDSIELSQFDFLFHHFDNLFSGLVEVKAGDRAISNFQKKIIQSLQETVVKFYPNVTLHASTTLTGYIASGLGLLDSEQTSNSIGRKANYRKYLRDSTQKIIKKPKTPPSA